MATKAQRRRKLVREMWTNTASSTGDRTTKADDIRLVNANKVTKADLSLEWVKARGDITA